MSALGIDKLMVGNSRVAASLAETLADAGSSVTIMVDPVMTDAEITLHFGRDSHVGLLDRSWLIPFEIQDPLLMGHLMALAPSSSAEFFCRGVTNGYGQGFLKESIEKTIQIASKNGIACKLSKTCLEGGNAFVFSYKEEPQAIVGLHSLSLSCIALDEQHYFESDEGMARLGKSLSLIKEPSANGWRWARNLSLYGKKKPLDQRSMAFLEPSKTSAEIIQRGIDRDKLNQELTALFGSESNYKKLLFTDPEKLEEYRETACLLDAKMNLTQEIIAEELLVKTVHFVAQRFFHIDMEMAVDPEGTIYIHDNLTVIETLPKALDNYSGAARIHELRAGAFLRARSEALKTKGLSVISLPGLFEASNAPALNFMNGCFIQGSEGKLFFCTAGDFSHKERFLADVFERAMTAAKPYIKVLYIDLGRGLFQEIMRVNGGGLHCLTWEC